MDTIEAKKNLKLLEEDRVRLLSLNHLNSTHAFKSSCEARIRQISEYIKAIRSMMGE